MIKMTKKTINKDKAKQLIEGTKGQIFSGLFIKKDGQHRLINARTGVTKHLKQDAKKQPYNPIKHDLITVYDMSNKGYRMININTLQKLIINKIIYKIK
tara:strand:- start:809 stop:1105 length:297 start_codon:yes stop_codon:yes gene_type:complete